MTFVATLSEVLTALSAVAVAIVAIVGVNTWRSQLRGTTEYELARRVLRAVYHLRDELQSVRSAFVSVGEMHAALESAGVPIPSGIGLADDKTGYRLAYGVRWRRLAAASAELEAELLEAEVHWDAQLQGPAAALRDLIARLGCAIDDHLNEIARPSHVASGPQALEVRKRVLWRSNDVADESAYDSKLRSVVADFERVLRPKVGRTH